VDGKAIGSVTLAVAAVVAIQWWAVSTVLAVAAVALALASRRSLRADPMLRGTALSLAGFLIGACVLVFATVGPALLGLVLVTIAPLPG